jgi:hypothetical protein
MRRLVGVIGLSLAACASPSPSSSGSASSSGGLGSEGSSTTDGCPTLPPCDFCPGEFSALCGMPCAEVGSTCSNEIGDGMSCSGGTWQCVVHPPLGEGCNSICEALEHCTEAGCTDGITLQFVAADPGFAAGAYALAIDRDGDASSCTFVVSDGPGCAVPPCVTETTCNALYDLSGVPPQIVVPLPIATALSVTLSRDGEALVEGDPELAYALSTPNGPGCGPVCAIATAVFELP